MISLGRLRRARDIRRAFRHGKRISGQFTNTYHVLSAHPRSRAVVIVSKKLGRACRRNRLRRRIREILRRECCPPQGAVDVAVVAKPPAAEATFDALRADLVQNLSRAGLANRASAPGDGTGSAC